MSSVSVKSSQVEKSKATIMEELESIKKLNVTLEAILQHFRSYRQGLVTMTDNMLDLSGQNENWIKVLSNLEQ